MAAKESEDDDDDDYSYDEIDPMLKKKLLQVIRMFQQYPLSPKNQRSKIIIVEPASQAVETNCANPGVKFCNKSRKNLSIG